MKGSCDEPHLDVPGQRAAAGEHAGRFAVSDVIVRGEVPEAIRRNVALWTGCVAGALSDRDYLDKLARTGFADAGIELTRIYGADDARDALARAHDAGVPLATNHVCGMFGFFFT